jgi:hypothetical protein
MQRIDPCVRDAVPGDDQCRSARQTLGTASRSLATPLSSIIPQSVSNIFRTFATWPIIFITLFSKQFEKFIAIRLEAPLGGFLDHSWREISETKQPLKNAGSAAHSEGWC